MKTKRVKVLLTVVMSFLAIVLSICSFGLLFARAEVGGTYSISNFEGENLSDFSKLPEGWVLRTDSEANNAFYPTFENGEMTLGHWNYSAANGATGKDGTPLAGQTVVSPDNSTTVDEYWGALYEIAEGRTWEDFTFSMTFKVAATSNSRRNFVVYFHTSEGSDSMVGYNVTYRDEGIIQPNVRLNKTTETNIIPEVGGYNIIEDGEYHTFKMTVVDNVVSAYMDDMCVMSQVDVTTKNADAPFTSGGMGLLFNGMKLTISSLTVTDVIETDYTAANFEITNSDGQATGQDATLATLPADWSLDMRSDTTHIDDKGGWHKDSAGNPVDVSPSYANGEMTLGNFNGPYHGNALTQDQINAGETNTNLYGYDDGHNINHSNYYGTMYNVANGRTWGDFTYTMNFKVVTYSAPVGSGANRWFALKFHTQNGVDNGADRLSGYGVFMRFNGETKWQVQNATATEYADAFAPVATATAMTEGSSHTLTVTMEGTVAKAYLDSALVSTIDYADYSSVASQDFRTAHANGGFSLVLNGCQIAISSVNITDTVADVSVAPTAPASATYSATSNLATYRADGTVTVTAEEGKVPSHYRAYWGNEMGKLDGYKAFQNFASTGTTTMWSIPANSVVPEGADRILVYSYSALNGKESNLSAQAMLTGKSSVLSSNVLAEYQIASDVHIQDIAEGAEATSTTHNQNFASFLSQVNSISPNTKGIFLNGDIADGNGNNGKEYKGSFAAQYETLNVITDAAGLTSKIYVTAGNHEFFGYSENHSTTRNQDSITQFRTGTADLGTEYARVNGDTDGMYYYVDIAGSRFIMLAGLEVNNDNAAYLGNAQKTWFKNTLANTPADRSIFVLLHQGFNDTVAGTWGLSPNQDTSEYPISSADNDFLRTEIAKYSNAIWFTGHSHASLGADSIYVDDGITAINTASVAYTSKYVTGTNSYVRENGSEAWFVEVTTNEIVFKGRDLKSEQWIPEAQFVVARTTAHDHELTHYPRVNATEGKTGMQEHWHCEACGLYFLDANAQEQTTAEALVIPAKAKYESDAMKQLTTENFYIQGAALRLVNDGHGTGIRYRIVMEQAIYDALYKEAKDKGATDYFETGVLLMPKHMLNGKDLTIDFNKAQGVMPHSTWSLVNDSVDRPTVQSTFYVYNVPAANNGTDIAVVAYVKMVEEYFYTQLQFGSMAFVADRAINAENSTLTKEQKTNLTANYCTFALTYEYGNGTANSTASVTYNTKLTAPEAPTRAGYEFLGWYVGEVPFEFTADTVVTDNLTLTAKWREVSFIVTFTGDYVTEWSDSFTATDAMPADPTSGVQGVTFDGWYNGDTKVTSFADLTGNVTLTARWLDASYTVRFVDENGKVLKSLEKQYADVGSAISYTPASADQIFTTDNKVYYLADSMNAVTGTVLGTEPTYLDVPYHYEANVASNSNWTVGVADDGNSLKYTPAGGHRLIAFGDLGTKHTIEATFKPTVTKEVGTGFSVINSDGKHFDFLLGGWSDIILVRINHFYANADADYTQTSGSYDVATLTLGNGSTVFSRIDKGEAVTLMMTVNDGVYTFYEKVENGRTQGYRYLCEFAPKGILNVYNYNKDTGNTSTSNIDADNHNVRVGLVSWNTADSLTYVSNVRYQASVKGGLADQFTTTNVPSIVVRENGFTIVREYASAQTYKYVKVNSAPTGKSLTAEATFTWYGANDSSSNHFNGGFAIKQGDNVIIFKMTNYNRNIVLESHKGNEKGEGYFGIIDQTVLGGASGDTSWKSTSSFPSGTSLTLRLMYMEGYLQIFRKNASGDWEAFSYFADVNTDALRSDFATNNADINTTLDWRKVPIVIDPTAPIEIGFGFEHNNTGNGHVDNISIEYGVSEEFMAAYQNKVNPGKTANWETQNMTISGNETDRSVDVAVTSGTVTNTNGANPLTDNKWAFYKTSDTKFVAQATFEYVEQHYSGGFGIKYGDNLYYYFPFYRFNTTKLVVNGVSNGNAIVSYDYLISGVMGDNGTFAPSLGTTEGQPITVRFVYNQGYAQLYLLQNGTWNAFTDVMDMTTFTAQEGGTLTRNTPVQIGVVFWRDWSGKSKVNDLTVLNDTDALAFKNTLDSKYLTAWDTQNLSTFTQDATTGAVSFDVPATKETGDPTDQKYVFYPTPGQSFTAEATFKQTSATVPDSTKGFRGGFAFRQNGYAVAFLIQNYNPSLVVLDSNGNEEYVTTSNYALGNGSGAGTEGLFATTGEIRVRVTYNNGIAKFEYFETREGEGVWKKLINDVNLGNTLASKPSWYAADREWKIGNFNVNENVEIGVMFGTYWTGTGRVENLTVSTSTPPPLDTTKTEELAYSAVKSFENVLEIGYADTNGLGNTAQGAASYGKYYFQFENTHDRVLVIDLDTLSVIDTITLTANSAWHSNTANFGTEIYSDTGFPLLYVAQENLHEHKTLVYAVRQNGNDFSLELKQTIIYPSSSESGVFYQNSYIDGKNNAFWVSGYTDTNYWSGAYANQIYMMQYALPSLADGEVVTLSTANIVKTVAWPFMYALQGGFFKDGIFYQVYGGSDAGRARGLRIVNLYDDNAKYVDISLLNADLSKMGLTGLQNSADDAGYADEMEAITFYNGAFYIGCVHGRMYKLVLSEQVSYSNVTWSEIDLTGKIENDVRLLYNNTTPADVGYNQVVGLEYNVDISAYDYVQVTCALWKGGNNTAIIFYNANKEVVKTYTVDDLSALGVPVCWDFNGTDKSYSYNVDAVQLVVPEDAVYIRFSNKTGTGTDENNHGYGTVTPVLYGGTLNG